MIYLLAYSTIMTNPLSIILEQMEIGKPEVAQGVAVLPLRLPSEAFDMQTLSQAVEQGIIEVLESESVNVLRVGYSNPAPTPILIPYLQVVTGGKQDRMVTVPIILSPATTKGETRDIPVNCVEQGRWRFSRDGGQATTARFDVHQKVRMSPSMGFANVGASQERTWGSIRKYRAVRSEVVPEAAVASQSFAEMEELAQKAEEERKELDSAIKKLLNRSTNLMADQSGLALFVGNDLVGVELYGSSNLWQGQKEGIKNSFLSELSIREIKEATPPLEQIEGILRTTLDKLALERAENVELGNLFVARPDKDKDYSALLIEHEDTTVEFYYAKGQKEFLAADIPDFTSNVPIQMQEQVQRRVSSEELELMVEVPSQAAPDEDPEED
ncbi:MAG: ARPP-1 family domain-containing protein [Candidatus Thorarchaeota archaeon]